MEGPFSLCSLQFSVPGEFFFGFCLGPVFVGRFFLVLLVLLKVFPSC